ncbi:MAG: hypothetical protein HZA51_02660 [Planctomycetes bacterium]|nr:hypothetical protein [Planctomycetota bacterium]
MKAKAIRKRRSYAGSLRKQAEARLAHLPLDRLRLAAEFLRHLNEYADPDIVEELTKAARLRRALNRAEKQIAAGRVHDWRKVRN